MGDDTAASRAAVPRACLLVGPVIGAWAAGPPFLGPKLHVAARVEVTDHVVPGAIVVVVTLLTVLALRQVHQPVVGCVSGFVIVLAGLWMVATHLPLVRQALQHQVPVGAVAFHTAPGLAVVALGSIWSVTACSVTAAS